MFHTLRGPTRKQCQSYLSWWLPVLISPGWEMAWLKGTRSTNCRRTHAAARRSCRRMAMGTVGAPGFVPLVTQPTSRQHHSSSLAPQAFPEQHFMVCSTGSVSCTHVMTERDKQGETQSSPSLLIYNCKKVRSSGKQALHGTVVVCCCCCCFAWFYFRCMVKRNSNHFLF